MHDISIRKRFWNKVDRLSDDECWPWTGNTASIRRYGRFSIDGKSRVATHVSWEIANNKPFPDGLFGCHTCDNPICVNPKHIWPGTQTENMQDCMAKGRFQFKPKLDVCKNGHDLTAEGARGTRDRCAECNRMHSKKYNQKRRKSERVRRTTQQQASDFVLANDESLVVAGRAIGGGGKGGFYTLANGEVHRIGADAMRMLPEGYPRWMEF